MEKFTTPSDDSYHIGKSLEVIIKVGLVLGLITWCFIILKPFLMITLWGVIIAIAVYPMYKHLKALLGNRGKLASVLITLFMLSLIMLPVILFGSSLADAVVYVKDSLSAGRSLVPPPVETVKSWPLIGPKVFDIWQHASQNLSEVAIEYKSELMTGLTWFLSMLTNAGLGVLMFLVSVIISGAFLVFADSGTDASHRIAVRLMGERGIETVANAEITIRNVARGILGVAFIQAFLAGIGFLVAGIPGAGLWALISFVLAIVQIGIGPVVIGVLIFAFLKLSTMTAILLTVWCAPLLVIDNVLKPLLLGRGAPVPMLVIFLGAIGGFISFGIIGLFVGAVVLSLGYNLFILWLGESK
ncbi:MAG: AI-2E family transporter [Bacteroidetes bacterium]|nr:AI-2E family transporter [Bacteroidota bacterium]